MPVLCMLLITHDMKKYAHPFKQLGFTLLELLVVIGIIGILVALATVSYSATQVAGRDSRRKQDLVAMQNALEQYYSANTYKYPTTCSDASSYMKSAWPTDPTNDAVYFYDSSCLVDSYCLCATMEKNTSGNSASNCNWSGGKTHYCVGNLQ